MMNKRIKAKWLKALRSGKYKQGRNTLMAHNKFCCLGVLCDLHSKSKDKSAEEWEPTNAGFYLYIGSENFLPTEVLRWAELDAHDPVIDGVRLSQYNDEIKGYGFKRIANLIEAHL